MTWTHFLLMRTFAVFGSIIAFYNAAYGESSLLDFFSPDANKPMAMPQAATVKTDSHGNLLINGQPKFLAGAQIDGHKRDLAPTPGYDNSLRWLYEGPINYDYCRRVGLDSVGLFTSDLWIKHKYDNKYRSWFFDSPADVEYRDIIHNLEIPLYIDFSCFPWSHGRLYKSNVIPDEIKNKSGESSQGNHWVPYDIIAPQGRALYRKMWAWGTQQMLEANGNPLFYELFNEPAYSDVSAAGRKGFSAYLANLYKTPENMNVAWGTSYASFDAVAALPKFNDSAGVAVEWCKYLEDAFVELCREGITTIKQIDTRDNTQFTVQALGMNSYRVVYDSHINLYKLSLILNATSTPTGGGLSSSSAVMNPPATSVQASSVPINLAEGILQRHFIRAISDGKPIYNGEAYGLGYSQKGIRNAYWMDLVRGGNGSYLFVWAKRAWDPLWKTGDGKKLAEKFPYMILNPYATSAETLTGAQAFKQELATVADIFVPRENRLQAKTALLFSYPTERYAPVSGSIAHNKIRSYAAALEFSHIPIDVLFEEQLTSGKQDAYQVIVAAGLENIYPQTAEKLKDYVQRGGILIAGLEPMAKNEYGQSIRTGVLSDLKLSPVTNRSIDKLALRFPQYHLLPGNISAKAYGTITDSTDWKTVATLHDQPAIVCKKIGKGTVYYIAVETPDYGLASILGGLLQQHQINPSCELTRVSDHQLETNVEVRCFQSGALSGYLLYNWDCYPKLVSFKIDQTSQPSAGVVNPIDGYRCELVNGAATLVIPPEDRLVVVTGNHETLMTRFGQSLPTRNTEGMKLVADRLRQKSIKDQASEASSFTVDTTKILQIDLRSFANRGFEDRIADDGKGGWTDQGENSLIGVPWGTRNFAGVPFTIIRFDENFDKTCIVLKSPHIKNVPEKVTGIPVDSKAHMLYFLSATA